MQRPKPLQFDARPEIKVYVASWAAAALDAWLLKFVIEEVLGFPVSLLSSSLPQFASDTSALQALARGDAHIFPEVRQSFHL
jgi:ABC-type proline/glycine betaine transport system substrate-binding protein